MFESTTRNEVSDSLDYIEAERQRMSKSAGPSVATGGALRKLQTLHDREQENLRRYGPGGRHRESADAVATEIAKLSKLLKRGGATTPGASLPRTRLFRRAGPFAALKLWAAQLVARRKARNLGN